MDPFFVPKWLLSTFGCSNQLFLPHFAAFLLCELRWYQLASAVSVSLRQSDEGPLFRCFLLSLLTFKVLPWFHAQHTFLIPFWKVKVVREIQFWSSRPICGMSLVRLVTFDYLTFYFLYFWHRLIAFLSQEQAHFVNCSTDFQRFANWQKRALSLVKVFPLDQPLPFFRLRYSCDMKSLWGSWMGRARITDSVSQKGSYLWHSEAQIQ